VSDAIAAWLYGTKVALVTRERRLRLAYTEEALQRFELGTPLLSIALPLKYDRYNHLPVYAFLEGLLPEGESRRAIARDVGVVSDDTFGMIRALGRECAGAIVFQPEDEPPPPVPTTEKAQRLTDDELAELIVNLREAPLGVGDRVRISLAGVQEKLLLTKMHDGSWGRPIDGTPSTHILKPAIARFPNTVENEAFCMRVAKHLGLDVSNVATTTIGGRKLLVVERYDRSVAEAGAVERIHQEDFCQATHVPPTQKYEDDGGPSLRKIAGILQVVAPAGAATSLLRAVILNVLLGNGDAHGKNFSLLHERSGVIRLAPLYDLMSTFFYNDNQLAMRIDNVLRINQVRTIRLLNEAEAWGMNRDLALEVVIGLLARVPEAVEAAVAETPDLPPELPALVLRQLAQLNGPEA
jgi:serine/threonine-protein kinase HipA